MASHFIFWLAIGLFSVTSHQQLSLKTPYVDEATQRAKLISGDRPKYPPLAAQARIEGCVRLKFIVTTDGAVRELTVIKGHPLLVQSALNSVRTWRYRPTLVDGAKIEILTSATVEFFLAGGTRQTFLAPYRKDVEKHPIDAKAHFTLASFLHEVGELDEALREYQQALALKSDLPGPHMGIARIFQEKGDFKDAVPEFRADLRFKSKNQEVHKEFAGLLEHSGDLDAALVEMREAMRIGPNDSYMHYSLGRLLVLKNEADAAIVELQKALKENK